MMSGAASIFRISRIWLWRSISNNRLRRKPTFHLSPMHRTKRIRDGGMRASKALGDRADGSDQVGLVDLEVGADSAGANFPGQQQQRRPALGRLGQPCYCICEARSLVNRTDAEST